MNTTQWECFEEVARTLSFARAAENLYMTQSTVSYHIKSLEKEMRVTLFSRNGRSIALTEAGHCFYREMMPVKARLEEAVDTTRRVHEREQHILTLLVRRLCGSRRLADAVRLFTERCPSSRVDVITEETRLAGEQLLRGEVRLAYCFQYEVTGFSQAAFLPLTDLSFYVLAEKGHPFSDRDRLALSDLSGERLILSCTVLQENRNLVTKQELERLGLIIPPPRSNFDSMFLAVESGAGITILPCSPDLEFAGVVKIPLADLSPASAGLAWLKAGMDADLAAFLKAVTAEKK